MRVRSNPACLALFVSLALASAALAAASTRRGGPLPAGVEAVRARDRAHVVRARRQRAERGAVRLLGRAPRPRRGPRPGPHAGRLRVRIGGGAERDRVPGLGRTALRRAVPQGHVRGRRPRPRAEVRLARGAGRQARPAPQGPDLRPRRRPHLPRLPAARHRREAGHDPERHERRGGARERRLWRVVHAVSPRQRPSVPPHPPRRPLGERDADRPRSDRARQEGDREPARHHEPPGEPVLRDRRGRPRRRGARPRLVRRPRVERQLEDHRRAHARRHGARRRRLQRLRLRLPPRARRDARDASLLRRLHEGRLRRGLAPAARAARRTRSCPTARRASCGPSSTTPGRRRSSPSTSRARRRSPRRRRGSASSAS